MPIEPHVVESRDIQQFKDLARRYHMYWSMDYPRQQIDDHVGIRIALGEVILDDLAMAQHSTIAFCGTGPEIARQKDLSGELIGIFLKKYAEVILSDFSVDTLRSSYWTIQELNNDVAARSSLVIRDHTRDHLSSRFDTLLRSKIDDVSSPEQMDQLIAFICSDVSVEAVEQCSLPKTYGRIDAVGDDQDEQQGLQFDKVLRKKCPVRLIVANLLLSGMFAVTEALFRRKVYELQQTKPRDVNSGRVITWLRSWHDIVLQLNNKVAKGFLEDALHANDELDQSIRPTVFLSVDEDVSYTGLDRFPRIDMKEVTAGMDFRTINSFTWDHTHEELPHRHNVAVGILRTDA